MEIKAKVISVFEPESGMSKSGNPWTKQGFVVETFEQYAKQVYFSLFGDKITLCPAVGTTVTVHFDLSSRSWVDSKGATRWSTEAIAWKVDTEVVQHAPQQPFNYAAQQYAQPPMQPQQPDKLPF
jgi:hypothetical protein